MEEETKYYRYRLPSGFIVTKKYKITKQITFEKKIEIYDKFKEGATKVELQLEYNLSQPTLRKYIKEVESKKKAEILTNTPSKLK